MKNQADIETEYDSNVLYQQCYAGNIKEVQKILALHSSLVDRTDPELLIYTIRGVGSSQKKIEILELLEKEGVALNLDNDCALEWAVKTDNLDVTGFLLEKNLNANQDEGILLYYAAKYAKKEMFSLLLNAGAKLDQELITEIGELGISGDLKQIIDEQSY